MKAYRGEERVCLLFFSGKIGWWLKTWWSTEMFVFPHTCPGSKLLKIAAVTLLPVWGLLWVLAWEKQPKCAHLVRFYSVFKIPAHCYSFHNLVYFDNLFTYLSPSVTSFILSPHQPVLTLKFLCHRNGLWCVAPGLYLLLRWENGAGLEMSQSCHLIINSQTFHLFDAF